MATPRRRPSRRRIKKRSSTASSVKVCTRCNVPRQLFLDKALEFEFIDSIDRQSLERIRAGSQLVRASVTCDILRDLFAPTGGRRAHLAVALEVLVVHPPTQGLRMQVVCLDFTCATSFGRHGSHSEHLLRSGTFSDTQKYHECGGETRCPRLDPADRLEPIGKQIDSAEVLRALASARSRFSSPRVSFRCVDLETPGRMLNAAHSLVSAIKIFLDMLNGPLVNISMLWSANHRVT